MKRLALAAFATLLPLNAFGMGQKTEKAPPEVAKEMKKTAPDANDAAAPATAKVGEKAPTFTLAAADGTEHSLSDLTGKIVVLEWINPECPFVKKHYGAGNMQAIQKDFTGRGVVWFTVNSSAPGKQGHLTAESGPAIVKKWEAAPTALLFDHDGKVGRAYGAKVTPHMYVIDGEGTLVYAGAIDDKPSTDPADIEGSTNYVRSAVEETLAGKPVTTATSKAYGCGIKY